MEGLRPEVDELDRFKHRAASPKDTKNKPKQEKPVKPATQAKNGSAFSVFLFLLLVAGFSAAGWFSWQQKMEIDRLNERLGDASGFIDQSKLLIARLEGKLSETGEVLAETGTSAEKKLAFLDTEMRKLWGVSNDRNKKAIETNQAALAELADKVEALQKSSSAEAGAFKQQLASVNAELQKVTQLAGNLSNELAATRSAYERDVASLKKQLIDQKQVVDGFRSETRTYLERMAKMDLAFESINASRRQLNERVVDLDKRLNDVLLKLSPSRP
jgi:chromosome segregation ATPase